MNIDENRDTFIDEKAIHRLRKGLVGGKEFLIILFIVIFLSTFGYWCYEIYYIHSHDFNLSADNDIEILEAAAHEVVAFQACILAFLFLAFLIYFL
jgi:magnesium-transporting ATPase (P-type)